MGATNFLKPDTPVADIYQGVQFEPPATSLDFIIRVPGQAITDRFIRIQSLKAQDRIGDLFTYQVSFRSDDLLEGGNGSIDINFDDIIGSSATIRVGLPLSEPDSSYPDPALASFFNGIVTDVALQETGSYTCIIRPELWRLTLSNDYKSYPQMTIAEVIEAIVSKKWGIACQTDALGLLATYRVQDWMQMGESDWDFIQSLLHRVDGFFYFLQDDTSHTVVFSNNPNQTTFYTNLPEDGTTDNAEPLTLFYTYTKQQSLTFDNRLLSFSYQQKMIAPAIQSTLAEPQAAWEEDATATLRSYAAGQDQNRSFHRYRLFQFGTTQELANTLAQEDDWSNLSGTYRLSGQSTSPKLKAGHVFQLKQAIEESDEREDVALMRPELDGKQFVVLDVQHSADVDGQYSNQFTAAPVDANAIELAANNTHVGSMVGIVVDQNGQTASYKQHWMLNPGKPNFDPQNKSFYFGEQGSYSAKGVYVVFPDLGVDQSPTWVKLPEHMTNVPEAGVVVQVERSRDDTDVPQLGMVYEQKGSKNIMPNSTQEITRIGDDYATSIGDNRSISFGASSAVDIPTAIKKIDQEYASGQYKGANYSVGGNYSYSVSDSGSQGILSKQYSEGVVYSESHGDRHDESHSTVVTSTSTAVATTNSSAVVVQNSNSATVLANSNSATGVAVSTAVTGASSHSSATGVSNQNSATGLSNINSATGMHKNFSAIGSQNDVATVGSSMSTTFYGDKTQINTKNGVNIDQATSELRMINQGPLIVMLGGPEIKI